MSSQPNGCFLLLGSYLRAENGVFVYWITDLKELPGERRIFAFCSWMNRLLTVNSQTSINLEVVYHRYFCQSTEELTSIL